MIFQLICLQINLKFIFFELNVDNLSVAFNSFFFMNYKKYHYFNSFITLMKNFGDKAGEKCQLIMLFNKLNIFSHSSKSSQDIIQNHANH